ncbi:hypothetical protein [Nocardia tengchongensis]|uniref:hypothetical protein n=1 Tax=Nocardia tengchongensis TaxID=2055889 RepID=UPI0036558F19
MSRTKNVLFFLALTAIFACGPLAVWADHAGWSGLQAFAIIGVLGISAGGTVAYLVADEAATRLARRDENGNPIPLTDIERELYAIFGLGPTDTPRR